MDKQETINELIRQGRFEEAKELLESKTEEQTKQSKEKFARWGGSVKAGVNLWTDPGGHKEKFDQLHPLSGENVLSANRPQAPAKVKVVCVGCNRTFETRYVTTDAESYRCDKCCRRN